jgi:glyoxylase-like metal-dependent hydrolase (beta-lactamase superfamily II)
MAFLWNLVVSGMRNPLWKAEVLLPGNWRGATCVLLSDGRRHIVVDTSMSHEAHQLAQALEARGLRPTDIDAVINTHFHIDHVLNNCLFSQSLIYASQESYEWCRALYSDLRDEANWERLALQYYPEMLDYEKARRLMGQLRKLALRWWDAQRLGDRSQFHWVETQALPEGLQYLITPGHVPGHLSLIVHGAGELTVIAGDALLSRDHEEQVLTMIPHKRDQYSLDRSRILSLGGRILPGHGLEFSASNFKRSGEG